MGRRKITITALLVLLVLLLAGCAETEKWPRVSIQYSSLIYDMVNLPLRDGYVFAEQMYTIQETDKGYDIVVHAVKNSGG